MMLFGTGGNPEAFYEWGGTSALQMPEYLHSIGLDAYEYQCTKGIKLTKDAAEILGENGLKSNIALSVHAPYFADISSESDEIIKNSIDLILETAEIANAMKADRVVVHMGTAKYITRLKGLEISTNTLTEVLKRMDEKGLGHIHLCLETMGKPNHMGTVDEVIKLCLLDERLIPALDFGHINAMTGGGLKTEEDFDAVLKKLDKKLGRERARTFHGHFSKVEFTRAGEKSHLTFENTEYGPEFEPLARALYKRKAEPVMICESMGTQDKDALYMKDVSNPNPPETA